MSEGRLPNLLKELEKAHDECWTAKVATYETSKRNAPLCVQIVEELGYMPKLVNNRIEQRMIETDGRDVLDEDFWANEDMVISLFECLGTEEFEHGCA